jgi:cytochrome c553
MTESEIKAVVRYRDGNRCTKCGITAAEYRRVAGRKLDVHRKTPGADYSVDECVTLCRKCHGPEPRRKRGERMAKLLADGANFYYTVRLPEHYRLALEELQRQIEKDLFLQIPIN